MEKATALVLRTTDWSESSRYLRKARAKAEELYIAITDKKHGVLTWIKGRW